MKKAKVLATLLAAALIAVSATGCGGGTKEAETTEDSSVSEEASSTADSTADSTEASSKEIPEARTDSTMESMFTIAGAGTGDDGNYYYLATNDDVSFCALVILSADGTQSMNVVGDVTSNGDGTLTIDDSYSGYSATFGVETIEGGIQLTMKDGTIVQMGDVEPATIIEIIKAIDDNTEIVNPLADSASGDTTAASTDGGYTLDDLKAALTTGYVGATENGDTLYWATTSDVTGGIFVMQPADGSASVGYVGAIVDNGDGSLTITDSTSGASGTVFVEQTTDNDGNPAIQLTDTDGTVAIMLPTNASDVIDAMASIQS